MHFPRRIVVHMSEKQHSMYAFEHNTSLFYLWSHNRDPILIPHLKKYSTLFAVQATLFNMPARGGGAIDSIERDIRPYARRLIEKAALP
jgi:hypothetical protein